MKREVIVEHLKHSLIFKGSIPTELAAYSGFARVQVVPEGQYVYRQGDASDVFYLIAMGETELILTRDDGGASIVGRIGVGGHFGEIGILVGKTRSLSVRAMCDLVLICFDKRYFRTALLGNTKIHNQLDAALAERLRVAFLDQADTKGEQTQEEEKSTAEDVILFKENRNSSTDLSRLMRRSRNGERESKTAKKVQAIIHELAGNNEPFLMTGEAGIGKSIIFRQIHRESERAGGHFTEIDLREYEPIHLVNTLFGVKQSSFPFAQSRKSGLFEQTSGGTLVLRHAHLMREKLQRSMIQVLESSTYCRVDSDRPLAMQSRIIFASPFSFEHLKSTGKILPGLLKILENNHYHIPPLRKHKDDLPRLVSHYLGRYSKEYGKKITQLSPEAMGIFFNYDWPGNLTELSSVIRRAVMLAQDDEIVAEEILLGLPKTEGKWEYNILRIDFIRKLLESWAFPLVPTVLVGIVSLATLFFLLFGPSDPDSNAGLTLGWSIGWPIMFCSFFFLARIWCSVCSLAVPGMFLQYLVKPKRRTPDFIKNYSGWIMAISCILVFWVEIVWTAYRDPYLTGGIILFIVLWSMIFSVLYSGRSWCRYVCPLGAVNAIFAMPSVVELRANSHVCMNRCQNHACFAGDDENPGCPMFRHPYLVDNNRDCIMCAKCIKSCDNSSIQLNVRLAPQELWALDTPRLADSFLIVSLGAMFFPFILDLEFLKVVNWLGLLLEEKGISLPGALIGTVIFFATILFFQVGYYLMVTAQSMYAKLDREELLSRFGYGFIPLMLGGYLAVYLELFVLGAGKIVPNIQELLGMPFSYENIQLISSDSTFVLQVFSILGGLLASLYATFRVMKRSLVGAPVTKRVLAIPFSFLITLACLFIFMV